eukprot:1161418-Alexandrium_andersonii.AAC.1
MQYAVQLVCGRAPSRPNAGRGREMNVEALVQFRGHAVKLMLIGIAQCLNLSLRCEGNQLVLEFCQPEQVCATNERIFRQ